MQNKITKRPTSFSSFIGQNKIKKTIKMMIDAKSKQNLAIDHILLVAQQGCGKTTMATIIANQTSLPIRYSQGLDINTKADIMVLLNGLQENEIIFIDEIHSINRNVLEFFYQIMENGDIDIKLGVGDDQKIVKLKIPNFTLVGATNQINKLPLPFRDRFGLICYFEKYKLEDIEKIISKFIISEKLEIEKTALSLISSSVSLNPRLAINLIKRIFDYCKVNEVVLIDKNVVTKVFNYLSIYPLGLNKHQIEYLEILANNNQHYSLNYISKMVMWKKDNIVNEIEPILIFNNLIDINFKGRKITNLGLEYLKKLKIIN